MLKKCMGKCLDFFKGVALSDETNARRQCERLCNDFPDLPRLKTIAAVGAYDAVIGGKRADSRRLTGIMSYLMHSTILIDPNFSIDVVNFSNKRNFLEEDKKYDLVFISFILRQALRGTFVYGSRQKEELSLRGLADFRGYYGVALSKDHNDAAWQGRVSSCDAKVIATYGGASEIGTQVLCDGQNDNGFVPLIDTPDKKVCHFSARKWNKYLEPDLESYASLTLLYNNAANDLPMPWLGFAAASGYLKTIAPYLSQETTLGRNARALRL